MNYNIIGLLILEIIVCIIVVFIGEKIYDKLLSKREERLFNVNEYLPQEEVSTLKQVFYLIIIVLLAIDIAYIFISIDYFYLAWFDIFLSLFCCIRFNRHTKKNIIYLLCLLPLPSITYLLTGNELYILLDLFHIIGLGYSIKLYYNKFKNYTSVNQLGYAILLLFTIVFISLIFTSIVEGVPILDALVMVSNAFTSNGYVVLGQTIGGKIDSVVLVWSGYVLSGVSTATLTAAIILKGLDKRFNEFDKKLDEIKEKK